MGILNVTPDSFSDGGLFLRTDAAIAHGLDMVAQGADIIDVGGESTRPGAEPVPEEVELARVIPVIEGLAGRVRVSIDTLKPDVAAAALEAGASLVNDVSSSLFEVAASANAAWVAVHMQGSPATMQVAPHYDDVVHEVFGYVLERARTALKAGVGEVWVDPGIGFGKTMAHNLSLLHHLPQLVRSAEATGCAGVMVGTSRKRFLGVLAAPGSDEPAGVRGPDGRFAGHGRIGARRRGSPWCRVHDVSVTVQAARLYGPAA